MNISGIFLCLIDKQIKQLVYLVYLAFGYRYVPFSELLFYLNYVRFLLFKYYQFIFLNNGLNVEHLCIPFLKQLFFMLFCIYFFLAT